MLKHYFSYSALLLLASEFKAVSTGFKPQNYVWTGGPFQMECPMTQDLMKKGGHFVKENVVATKVVAFKDDIFLLTPRYKSGVPATVSKLNTRTILGPVLTPYPDVRSHVEGECRAIQNAVDFYLDHLGMLWILDIGVVDTMCNPRCTCQPKLVVLNLHLDKVTMFIDLSKIADSASVLQSMVVEYGFGAKPFVYIADVSQAAILVCDVHARVNYRVLLPLPPGNLQMALCRRAPAHHAVLLFACHGAPGVYQIDTGTLRRGDSMGSICDIGDRMQPTTFLGSDPKSHTVYLKPQNSSSVLSWDLDKPPHMSRHYILHHGGPCCLWPTSVAVDAIKNKVLILESNYGDFLSGSVGTGIFHRLTVIPKL